MSGGGDGSVELRAVLERLEQEAQELDRRANAVGKSREPAQWLRSWEAKGVRRAAVLVAPLAVSGDEK